MSDNNDNPGRALVQEKTKRTNFPEGLRVLAVDDDVTCLKTLSTMLQKCRYQVTQTTKATEALELLRKNTDNYDIVITDVIMPDMDGFDLLRIIVLEMDVPVIMMSANDDRENVMKSVRQGARDYLVKPVRILELKNIWQHVMRKTVLDPNNSSIMTEGEIMENLALKKQRDRSIEKEGGTNTPSDGNSTALRKPRVSWSNELHNKFIDAVQQLDPDKAVPKKILEVMKDPQLTRENISSHLQKYRNPLKTKLDSMIKERTSNAGPNRLHGGLFNTTLFASSDNKVLPVLRHTNSSGEYSRSVDGRRAFHDPVISKHDTINASLLNERCVSVPLSQQDFLLQRNFHSSRMPDQVRPARPISVIGNVPSGQAWMANLSRRKMIDGPNIDMSSQISNLGARQSGGPIGFTSFSTGQSGPYSFPGFVGRKPGPSEVPPPGRVQNPCPPENKPWQQQYMDLMLQQTIHSSRMADQVKPARPISMLQNVALGPAWMTNPSRRKMIDGHHMHMSSQISNLGTGKSGAPVGYNSFGTGQSRAPIGFTSFCTGQSGPSFPGFLGRQPGPSEVPLPGLVPFDASTQLTPTSQPNPLPGSQHEARGFTAFSGRGGSAFRGLPTGCQAIDKLPVTGGQGTFMQLVTDDLKQENKGLQTSYSSTDDELSVLLKQFGKNSAPTL